MLLRSLCLLAASGAPGGDPITPVCTEQTPLRCAGDPRVRWSNFGVTNAAADCAFGCSARPRCTYVVYRSSNGACTAFETCDAFASGNGPWRICAVRGAPVQLPPALADSQNA
eukprot:gene56725-biopygen56884